MLHAQGIWIDKNGNQLPVREMSAERLSKLVDLLYKWSLREDNQYLYLRRHPLFLHVLMRIREVGLVTIAAYNFECAYGERSNRETLLY